MENIELKHILIAYKSTSIGLQQAHDEIFRLFNVIGQSEQLICQKCKVKLTEFDIYHNKCFKCGEVVKAY